jgi:eukaryotic-like serine/threonine-protein kinase
MPRIGPDRWAYVSPYLDRALDVVDERERGAWLASLREQEPALAADVEALLDEHRALRDEPFLEQAVPVETLGMMAGTSLGAYTLLSPIGRGGMGTVWLAERSDGRFERRVAIKFLNFALGGGGEERFTREGRILARLAHRHIAQLLDAGVSTTGQPYLVLEYVDGDPIERYCDEHALDVHARLRLFLDVLDAVAHAHASLVVHRDVKPSNVLVTSDGCVKLLDFGIAKLLEADDRGAVSVLTVEGATALTPAYAAPEQVTGQPVSTATDVYALGVLLYVLLTGRHPAGERMQSPADLVKAIVDIEPSRPSDVVARLRRLLRGDIDTIVSTALKKHPAERYPSVASMADDVRRHLRHEPIGARPDSIVYRSIKFVRRHAIGVAAAAIALCALLMGLVGTMWQARVASTQARRAEAAQSFLLSVFRVSDPSESKGRSITAREVLDLGAKRIETELADVPELQADMRTLVGRVYTQLGLYGDARPLLDGALDARRRLYGPDRVEIAESLDALGVLQRRQGDYAGAERTIREALAIFEDTVGASDPRAIAALNHLADVQLAKSEFDAAERTAQQALALGRATFGDDDPSLAESLTHLASASRRQGQLERGATLEEEALRLRRARFGDNHPDVVLNLAGLGLSMFDLGKYDDAERFYRQALASAQNTLGADHPDTLEIMGNLAAVLSQRGNAVEAEPLLRGVLSARRRHLGNGNPALVQHLAILATALRRLHQYREATSLYREALSITERHLGSEHLEAAKNLHDLAALLIETGELSEAEPLLRRCIAILQKRLGPTHSYVGRATTTLGQLLFARGDIHGAELAYREALSILRTTLPTGHSLTQDAALGLGRVLLVARRAGEAEPLLREAAEERRKAFGASDARTAEAEAALGKCLIELGHADAARTRRRSSG